MSSHHDWQCKLQLMSCVAVVLSLLVSLRPAWGADICTGDCNADGAVTMASRWLRGRDVPTAVMP